ncbi:hypothetical protein AMS68_003795 [Peltaster fructicola]|uniref:UDENN domain-containing protein n=1 Tax=Peltaster fructicola TaxID=286661 RepID=A0A6H0XUI6_9PEZI|nr:hypothetical protein AMS68_003795 [Peltaster fructicola]
MPLRSMPTATKSQDVGDTSAPLADYFFICGIESSQVQEDKFHDKLPPTPIEDTIDEDKELETDAARPTTPSSPLDTRRRSNRMSWEARKSIGSIINGVEVKSTASNRSSATIKPTQHHQQQQNGVSLSDDAFEQALKKFATERDSFLEDINITAGVVPTPTSKRPRPRTVRITQEDNKPANGIRDSVGSIRRRLSTMNSMKRQPSSMQRTSSTRTAKRMSNYNSVMPAPEPFHVTPDMHPLKRRYEPVLLDQYPTKAMVDESKRRKPFPDFVPMFAFPNDISVVSADERPRSTWHGFMMTGQDNNKLYGVCMIIWTPLNADVSQELERRCETWRRANMSNEERELASSLGERLSAERAKLSRLLAQLPSVPSGSDERDALEEEISSVEEKIGLMTDLLRPVRHGAASKIEGLTEGDTGFWIPRAYGILGREGTLTSFWKEWLRAVLVPMTNGAVLRVPASSPKVGVWQPLERYVVNLCVEALCPITSITQAEVAVRELRLYARKDALNEIPGSRNTDLYALFRCLSIPNILTLFEFALAESRIIFLSSHTAMLSLACSALTSLLYPLKWAGVLIPILPERLIQVLDAPCPYIVGVERRYNKLQLPDDDFCLVDLDEDSIESTGQPVTLPRPQRRKLQALLHAAAPHHTRFGVETGAPPYARETFPFDAFSSEHAQVFDPNASHSTLAQLVSESSASFGNSSGPPGLRTTIYNAFLQARSDFSRGSDRPSTSSTHTNGSQSSGKSPPSPVAPSPIASSFSSKPVSRNDSGFQLQASLREKRSGHFVPDTIRRNSTVGRMTQFETATNSRQFGMGSINTMRKSDRPVAVGHHPSASTSTLQNGLGTSTYAPSVYAQSTLAASTIMPQTMIQPVRDDETTRWVEGHCFTRRKQDIKVICIICDEKCEEDFFRCTGCSAAVHPRCITQVSLVCSSAFRPDQVRAAFVRCFASLFYTYRKFLHPASGDRRKAGLYYHFNEEQFLKSLPHGDSDYMNVIRQTQMFSEFIHEREATRAEEPSIKLFDEIILSKRNRGRTSFFNKSSTNFLSDTSDHLWRSAVAPNPTSRTPGELGSVTGRVPAKLDPTLMKEPRSIGGAPRLGQARTKRKPVASMLGLTSQSAEP